MPFDHLLLPLLGGYWFITHFNPLRFRAFGLSRYRLLFEAALYGFVALGISFLLTRLLIWSGDSLPVLGSVLAWWKTLVPFRYFGAAVGALLLGGLAPYWLNTWERWDPIKCGEKAIRAHGDLLLELLYDAQRERRPVMLTLSSGKVYIGWITLSSNLSPDMPYVVVLPTLSGYRDPYTQVIRFTTSYTKIYQKIKEQEQHTSQSTPGPSRRLTAKDFQVAMPMPDIRTATPYSRRVSEELFRL